MPDDASTEAFAAPLPADDSSSSTLGYGELRVAILLACVLVALVLGEAINFPFLALDDAYQIVSNPAVTGASVPLDVRLLTPGPGYIVPVTVETWRALFALGGGSPMAFHAFALVVHAAVALLVYRLARRLGARPAAALSALALFAAHPLVVQPVSWAICLKDLLMAAFLLCALLAFVALVRARDDAAIRRAWLGVVGFFLLAMLSKPTVLLLGLSMLAATHGCEPSAARRSARSAALVCLGIGLVIGYAGMLLHEQGGQGFGPEPNPSPWFPLSVLGAQLSHVLWPAGLHIWYPRPSGAFSGLTALGLGCVLALGALALRARGSFAARLLLGTGVALYLPVSNLVPFHRVMSDSYLYVPLAMLAIGAVLAVPAAASAPLQVAKGGLVVVLLFALGVSSRAQMGQYAGGHALWGPIVREHPQLFHPRRMLADELLFRRDLQGAAQTFVDAMKVAYEPAELVELGSLLAAAGRTRDAECVLIEAALHSPNAHEARLNYLLLLSLAPSYAPEDPAVAKHLLLELRALVERGELPGSPEMAAALQRSLVRLEAVQARAPTRAPRSCDVLKP